MTTWPPNKESEEKAKQVAEEVFAELKKREFTVEEGHSVCNEVKNMLHEVIREQRDALMEIVLK